MQFDVWSKALADLSVECIAAGVFEDGKLGTEAAALDKATGGRIKGVIARGDFSGRAGETLLLSEAGLEDHARGAGRPGRRTQLQPQGLAPRLRRGRMTAGRTRIRSVALAIERPAGQGPG